jgi:aspartate 1-decarboxylase
MEETTVKAARLEDWSLVDAPDNGLTAPEIRQRALVGIVTGHPNHDDGKRIRTSAIAGKAGEVIYTCSGAVYELGEPHPDYEAKFPGARRRVIDSIPPMNP